jgi:CrcB protein
MNDGIHLVVIALSGSLGAMTRHLVSLWVKKLTSSAFPLATFLINVSGCFLIGLWVGSLHAGSFTAALPRAAGPVSTGFLGGYTTFSTFSLEALELLQKKERATAAWYIVASVSLGLLAAWGGFRLAASL